MIAATIATMIAATSPASPAPPSSTRPPAELGAVHFEAIILDGATDGVAGLFDELELRLGTGVVVHATAVSEPMPSSFAWVTIATSTSSVQVAIVTHDGREFTREVASSAGQHARVGAGVVANMIDAIESNRLAPVRIDVPVPRPPIAATPQPPTTPPAAEPPAPAIDPPTAPAPAPAPAPRAWLSIAGFGGSALGLGPPNDVGVHAGSGGGATLHFVGRRGAVFGAALRGLRQTRSGFALARVRITADAGVSATWGRVALTAVAGPVIEPLWLVGAAGDRVDVQAPLVGGHLAVTPAVVLWRSTRSHSLRLGLDLDAAGTVQARRAAGALRVLHRTARGDDGVLRAGGFELSLALELELRIARVRKRTSKR
ncbi:MAG: hypothetical protein KBB21_21925 [Nannocystaceae bacterium]|nr:hypothetical protein [Nannocystaceae bacterium]